MKVNTHQVIVPINTTDALLESFFIKDGGFTRSGAVRRSTLLTCKRDFIFLRGSMLSDPGLRLDKKQIESIQASMPTFAAILVYCSSIDLLARVMKKKTPKNNSSKSFFLWSAKKWFNLSDSKCRAVWEMRCSMSHQYRIETNQRAVPHGFNGSMTYDRKDKKWVFNMNGMFGDIRTAIPRAYEHISKQKLSSRHKYAVFIANNGFYYTH